jgi:hypothetical protein
MDRADKSAESLRKIVEGKDDTKKSFLPIYFSFKLVALYKYDTFVKFSKREIMSFRQCSPLLARRTVVVDYNYYARISFQPFKKS